MQIEPWLPPALLTLMLWGLSVFLPKLAVARMKTTSLIVYHTAFFFLSALGVLLFYGSFPGFHLIGSGLALTMGAIGTLAQLCFLISLRNGTVTYAVLVSSLYPVVAVILARIFLHEELTLRQGIGIGLALAALILLVGAHDHED